MLSDGMYRPMPSTYETITDRIIKALEAAGEKSLPWRRSWHIPVPCNFETGRAYQGANRLVLECSHEFRDHRWLTFTQANKLGARVLKGSKSTPIILWREFPKDDEHDRRLLCRTYHLFNAEQVDGLPRKSVTVNQPTLLSGLERAEEIVQNFEYCPPIRHGGNIACYNKVRDYIRLPRPEHFDTMADYYSVAFHEMGHSTGSKRRLSRRSLTESPEVNGNRAMEELVAELSSAFLCSEAGICVEKQHVSYLQSWLRSFRNDPKFIVHASSMAQRSADFILGRYKPPAMTEEERLIKSIFDAERARLISSQSQ